MFIHNIIFRDSFLYELRLSLIGVAGMESNSYENLLNDSVLLNIKLVLEQSKDTLNTCHKIYSDNIHLNKGKPDIYDVHTMITVMGNTLSTTQDELIDLIREMLKLKKAIRVILDIG